MAVLWMGSLPPNYFNSPNLQTSWSHQRMPMMYIKGTIWSGFDQKLNWRSISIKPKIGRDLNSAKKHFCSKFGNCNFNWWRVMAWTSSKWGKSWLWSSIWPWRSQSIVPQNNRDLNQGLLHLLSKFGDPSWNGWWVIARTSSWLMHGRTHTQTDRRRQRQYPKAKTGLG